MNPQRPGFTLIELLVVISIVAVLAGMLLPSISMVRSAAQQASCTGNQRQVMMAMIAYAGDQEGLTPPIDSAALFNIGQERSPYRKWHIALMLGDYLPAEAMATTYTDNTHGYPYIWQTDLRWRNVVSCPAFTPGAGVHDSVYGLRSTHMTGEICFRQPWDGSARLDRIKADVPFLADTVVDVSPVPPQRSGGSWAHNAVWNNVKVYLIHRGKVVTGYPDGHIEARTASQLNADQITPLYLP
jgi:prepilin-type N-terminal cleavage/methylation domain-containing protein